MNEYYRLACEKGWHDNDERVPVGPVAKFLVKYLDKARRWLCRNGQPSARQNLAWVSLILTEWLEAMDDAIEEHVWSISLYGKPVGQLSGLADIWIRCMDTLGAHDCLDPGCIYAHGISNRVQDKIAYALGEAAEACRTARYTHFEQILAAIMDECYRRGNARILQAHAAKLKGIPANFDEAIRIKHEYNKTRSYRHGGKLA